MRRFLNQALFCATLVGTTLAASDLWAKSGSPHSQHHASRQSNFSSQSVQTLSVMKNNNTSLITHRFVSSLKKNSTTQKLIGTSLAPNWKTLHRTDVSAVGQLTHKHKQHPTQSQGTIPFDPGRGDGRVNANPAPPNTLGPGFVWVNNHWERAKATSGTASGSATSSANPTPPNTLGPGFVWVNNHWERAKAISGTAGSSATSGGGTVGVRDHRNGGNVNVRDHRNGVNYPQGNVAVGITPGGNTRETWVVGVGESPVDKAVNWLIDLFDGTEFHPGSVPPDRDHRDKKHTR
jgi:WXXGXW repeat (2 copies)